MTTCIYNGIFKCCKGQFKTRKNARIVVCTACNRKMRGTAYKTNRAIALAEQNECSITGCHCNHNLDCHHILPIAYGGGNEIENLRILCKHHHKIEHDKLRIQGKG